MAKKKRTIFVMKDNDLFVEAMQIGIHPLIIGMGEVPLVYWPHEGTKRQRNTLYTNIDAAIGWHEKELRESNGKSGSTKALEALKFAKEKFLAGKFTAE